MRDLESRDIIYGGNLNYHHMCRWYSGFFYNHPALADYEWYWRVEPGVTFFCDVPYDPFVHMAENKKEYGFTISLVEIPETIPSLWKTTMEFAHSRNLSSVVVNNTRSSSSSSSLFNFFTDDGGATYNGCHFWSNFEIARFDLYRSDLYEAFFDHLDKSGGFFYER